MLYSSNDKSFKHHVHPSLQRRIRIFLGIGALMLAVLLFDIWHGSITIPLTLVSIVAGAAIGFFTSRILHLSWNKDGDAVVSRIDRLGAAVLIGYILFEIARATLFETVIHTGSDPTAITYAFVSAALVARVFGLRGRILRILKEERVFGHA